MSAGARRLGVVGWPVAHSRSPAMHNAALAAAGLSGWRYQLLPLAPEVAAEALTAFGDAGLRGVNVTIPHKTVALGVATAPTERALAIGAANTLLYEAGGAIVADNTDGPGLTSALRGLVASGTVPAPRSALVLGAGGTARAAVWGLRAAGVTELAIWNRTPERAAALGAELGIEVGTDVRGADLLVNCTSVGLHPDGAGLDDLPLTRERLDAYGAVVDFVYASGGTALTAAARARGIPTVEGLELLVAQGALSFELFTGHPAPREVMRAAARDGYRHRP